MVSVSKYLISISCFVQLLRIRQNVVVGKVWNDPFILHCDYSILQTYMHLWFV